MLTTWGISWQIQTQADYLKYFLTDTNQCWLPEVFPDRYKPMLTTWGTSWQIQTHVDYLRYFLTDTNQCWLPEVFPDRYKPMLTTWGISWPGHRRAPGWPQLGPTLATLWSLRCTPLGCLMYSHLKDLETSKLKGILYCMFLSSFICIKKPSHV